MNSSTNLSQTEQGLVGDDLNKTSVDDYMYDYYMIVYDMNLMQLHINFLHFLRYALLIIVIVAVLGNVITIFVVLQKNCRKNSIYIYIASLAISDLCINYGTLEHWLILEEFVMTTYSTLDCKLRQLIPHIGQLVSSWMLCAIAFDRVIIVTIPHRKTSFCSLRMTYIVIAIIWMISTAYYSFLNSFREYVITSYGSPYCLYIPEMALLSSQYFDQINTLIVFVIPTIVISICTVIIVYRLSIRPTTAGVDKREKVRRSVTRALVKVNVFFVLLVGPICMMQAVDVYFKDYFTTPNNIIRRVLTQDVFLLLIEMNSVLNFYVYFLSGSKFRKDLFSLFTGSKGAQLAVQSSGQEKSSTVVQEI